MNSMKKIFAFTVISAFLGGNLVNAQTLNTINYTNNTKAKSAIQTIVESQRIPVGTQFKIKMNSPVNSQNSVTGTPFEASLLEDLVISNNLVLPSGTIVRGRVGKAKKSFYFSRNGYISLNFDHVVTPVGKQIPLVARVTGAANLKKNGIMSPSGGYWTIVGNSLDKGVDITVNATTYGYRKAYTISHPPVQNQSGQVNNLVYTQHQTVGETVLKAIPVIIVTPLAATAGVAAGSCYFVGKSTKALFKKGQNIIINPGDILEVTLNENMDVPLY